MLLEQEVSLDSREGWLLPAGSVGLPSHWPLQWPAHGLVGSVVLASVVPGSSTSLCLKELRISKKLNELGAPQLVCVQWLTKRAVVNKDALQTLVVSVYHVLDLAEALGYAGFPSQGVSSLLERC